MISDSHVIGWKNIPDFEITVVADINAEVAKTRAAQWGVSRWTSDYQTTLSDPEIVTCDICLPHSLHASVTIECLNAGKHVLCEKPIALKLRDALKVIAAQKASGKILMIGENWYYLPSVVKALQVYRAGEIGDAYSFRGNLDFPGLRIWPKEQTNVRGQGWRGSPEQAGGGILMDAGIHTFSVARMFMGEVEAVWAIEGKQLWKTETGLEDTFSAMCRFESGASGLFHFAEVSGWDSCHFDFTILGTKGVIEIDILQQTVRVHKEKQLIEYKTEAAGGMIEEIQHFVSCIERNRQPLSNAEDQMKSLAFVLAAYKSAENNGAPVTPEREALDV